MRNVFLLIILLVLFFSSCGKKEKTVQDILNSNNLKQIRLKKNQLEKKQREITNNIKLLSSKISKLDPNKKIPLITVIEAKKKLFTHFLELQGDVQTKKNILIFSEVPGKILKIYVKEGQYVKKGQILAKIDEIGLNNKLAQAMSSEALAKTTFERQKRLWKQKIGSEIQYLQAKTNYETQSNAVNNIRKNLNKYTIKAPFSGIIDEIMKEVGTVVSNVFGSQIFRIINLNQMYVKANVSENYISSIKKGKKVMVTFPILGKTINSKIRQTSNFINPENRTFKIEVSVPNKDKSIKPNLTAKLKINDYTNTKAILIPQNIISENSKGNQYIYIVEDIKNSIGFAKKINIETGKTQDGLIEILKGVVTGNKIISEGARSVKDGQKVKILNQD